jgi:hypothetical protein
MAEAVTERVRRYILDGSDQDLRRLLSTSQVSAEMARAAKGAEYGWVTSPFFLDLTLRKPITA